MAGYWGPLKIPQVILFNTMRVHRGPCNTSDTWRIVLFMTWPVGVEAAYARLYDLAQAKADREALAKADARKSKRELKKGN